MFDMYKDFYKDRIPYIKLEKRTFGPYSGERIMLKNYNSRVYYKDYSEPLQEVLDRYRRISQDTENEFDVDVQNLRVVLVSDDINRIRKSALIMAEGAETFSLGDQMNVGFVDEFDQDVDMFGTIIEIELDRDMSDERAVGNPYIIKTDTVVNSSEQYQPSGYLFRGLSAGELGSQCEAISSQQARNIFVGVTEELAQTPEIQRLLLERGFDLVRLPDVDTGYYRGIAEEMISFGGVKFETDDLRETLIGAIIKKCGSYISEERISTALTMGRLRMRPKDKVLKASHFADCFRVDGHNAYDKLMKMTGLQNLKIATTEYKAVRNEIKRNPLAHIEGRHLIFEGNPGGGKTMGAGLLAEILAAEGITNGTFVAASRKDIIGEYVGHTAPKIDKLFREAAGGVLFVDEAGFFLNRECGGYVDEAIKEFVRYMELCKDVTVIFAMYPGEAKRFVALDAGLASRISATVRFEDYSEEELGQIFAQMLKDRGYGVKSQVAKKAASYLIGMKSESGNRFGNARDARRLADAVVRAIAVRNDGASNGDDKDGEAADQAMMRDLNAAIKRMDMQRHTIDSGSFGFGAMRTVRRAVNGYNR